MYSFIAWIFTTIIFCSFVLFTKQQYTPDWTSLDKRSLPMWYDESKVGIFIHWGVFSVPSVYSEWYVFFLILYSVFIFLCGCKRMKFFLSAYRMWWAWKGDNPNPDTVAFMNKNYPPDWTYADFAAQFHAELYG